MTEYYLCVHLVCSLNKRRKGIKEVIMEAPEPEDYEVLLDKVTKEFKEENKK